MALPRQITTMADFLARYAPDAALFAQEVFDIEPYDWQRAAWGAYDRGERRISVASGHSIGKGWWLAITQWHHILTRYPQKTVCTAPSSAQLFDALWNDVKAFGEMLPPLLRDLVDITADRIVLKAAPALSFISARTSRADQPEAMQGVRSHGWTLLIADEASGVPDQVYEAADSSMSNARTTMILTGNPIRNTGYFYETHHELSHLWWRLQVSSLDMPHITQDWIEHKKAKYGEGSAEYGYRVLGVFPPAEAGKLIPAELVDAARGRDVAPVPGAIVWALDPARTGGDVATLCKRQNNVVLEPTKRFPASDLMVLCGRVIAEYKTTPPEQRPAVLCVDAIGYGAGVADRLREVQPVEMPALDIVMVNVSEAPSMENGPYLNLRSELYHAVRDWLQTRAVALPVDDELSSQLKWIAPKYSSRGKVLVSSKDELRKQYKRSPDSADALMLTFAVAAATLAGGTGNPSSRDDAKLRDFEALYV